MGRSSKGNLPWINAVGLSVSRHLSKRLARPLTFFQSGPYNQQKPPWVGVIFNDPLFDFILPETTGDSSDIRFGYYISRYYAKEDDFWWLSAGFEMLNPTLAKRFFASNIRSGAERISFQLHNWLNNRGEGSSATFGVDVKERYRWNPNDSLNHLTEQLLAYGNLGRIKKSVGWAITRFHVGTELIPFRHYSEIDLEEDAHRVSKTANELFQELDFLYTELFPRNIDPARMSGGQNRALSKVQPDRICSWLESEDSECLGQIEAAHLKPDRQGGPATADNLIWLCQFHHQLVDLYLKADMKPDPRVTGVIASVVSEAPSIKALGGKAWSYWKSIPTKTAWDMPLKKRSIAHLFDRRIVAFEDHLEE